MPDDPLFIALQRQEPLTLDIVHAAKRYRLAEIDELWAEVRILEALIKNHPGPAAVLTERDPPLEEDRPSCC
jgi:hypothetical protein